MVTAGRLHPLYRGVYAVGHRPVGPRSREMAVVLMAGVRALSRQSALALWAMSRAWHGPVHVSGRTQPVGPGVRHPPHAQPARPWT